MTEERRQSYGRRKTDTGETVRGRRKSDVLAGRDSRAFIVLAWGLIAVIVVLFVALIGLSVVVKNLRTQQRDTADALAATRKNAAGLNAGTCVIVATLENGAASVRSTLQHPAAPLPPDRRAQLAQSLAFQVGLANSLRSRVTCPDPPPSTKIPKNVQSKPKTRTTG